MQEPNYKNTAKKQLYNKKALHKKYHFVFGTFTMRGSCVKIYQEIYHWKIGIINLLVWVKGMYSLEFVIVAVLVLI